MSQDSEWQAAEAMPLVGDHEWIPMAAYLIESFGNIPELGRRLKLLRRYEGQATEAKGHPFILRQVVPHACSSRPNAARPAPARRACASPIRCSPGGTRISCPSVLPA